MSLLPGEGSELWYTTRQLVDKLGTLTVGMVYSATPWGSVGELSLSGWNFTVKHLQVFDGHRTSLQVHEHKDEVIILIGPEPQDAGFIEIGNVGSELQRADPDAGTVHIPPGRVHRVTGPLEYLEISTYDGNTDTVRLADDYGRA